MHSKITGRQEKKFDANNGFDHYSSKRHSCKEEFEDWPQTFLAIGTFGSSEVLLNDEQKVSEAPEPLQENQYLCVEEEVIELQNEIGQLMNPKSSLSADGAGIGTRLNFSSKICNGDEIVLNKPRDLIADQRNSIRQRSLCFLLKKMLVCGNGLALHPNVRDSIPESRMEKILRRILHKKIHPQSAPRATPTKYLKRNHEEQKEEEDGSKWVKTDSEYIVLEI